MAALQTDHLNGVISTTPISVTRSPIWLSILLAAVLAAILWFTGISAFPLILAALIVFGLGLAQFGTLPLGILSALAFLLGGYAVVLRFAAHLGLGLAGIGGIGLLLLVSAGLAVLLTRRKPLILPSRRAVLWSAALLVVALIATVVWVPFRNSVGVGPAWAMHNDAVIQMIKAQAIMLSDGLDYAVTPNSSPLTAALVAMVAAAGRAGIGDPNRFLENDVLRMAELWGLLVLASSVLAGWITWRTITLRHRSDGGFDGRFAAQPTNNGNSLRHRAGRTLLPIIAALIAAALPLTWYFAGFAFAFGFLNYSLALVILLLTWALWLELPNNPPVLVAAALSATGVALLATWAPLALIAAALAILALVRALRNLIPTPPPRTSGWIALALATIPIPLYALLVTIPDFGLHGDALAVEGGISPLPISHLVGVVAFTIIGIVLLSLRTANWLLPGGLAAVLGAGAIAIGFLVLLNTRADLPGWGYYPIKAAWTATSLLLIIAVAAWFGALFTWTSPVMDDAAAVITDDAEPANSPADNYIYDSYPAVDYAAETITAPSTVVPQSKRYLTPIRWAGLALITLSSLAIMRQYTLGPLTLGNAVAPLQVLRSTGYAAGPWRANILFDSYREDRLTLLAIEDARWMIADQVIPGDGRADQFANFWLLQVNPGAGVPGGWQNDIRTFAYTLDPRSPEQICEVAERWESVSGTTTPTEVFTVDATLPDRLAQVCSTSVIVTVADPAWPRS